MTGILDVVQVLICVALIVPNADTGAIAYPVGAVHH